MARRNTNNEAQLSLDITPPSQHDYSQEVAGEFPFVKANDHLVPRPFNEVIDDIDLFTSDDLVDAYWDRHNELFGHKPARREAIEAAKALYEQSLLAKKDSTEDDLSPERKNILLALDTYMDYIASTNQLRGMRGQFHADLSSFKKQYGHNAKDVLHGAQQTRDHMHQGYQDAIQILFNARKTAPELAEFASNEDLESFAAALETSYGGSGREYSKERNKIRDTATRQLGGKAAVAAMALDPPKYQNKQR